MYKRSKLEERRADQLKLIKHGNLVIKKTEGLVVYIFLKNQHLQMTLNHSTILFVKYYTKNTKMIFSYFTLNSKNELIGGPKQIFTVKIKQVEIVLIVLLVLSKKN